MNQIRETIQTLRERAEKLQAAALSLEEFIQWFPSPIEPSTPSVAAPARPKVGRPKKAATAKATRGTSKEAAPSRSRRPRRLSEDVREMIPQFNRTAFSAAELRARLLASDPEIKSRITSLPVLLIDMASRGELTRTGHGQGARYVENKLRGSDGRISDLESRYRKEREAMNINPPTEV